MPRTKRQTRTVAARKSTIRKPTRRTKTCHQKKVGQIMHDWKAKKLKSSSGRRVTKHKQAVAIALSVADRKCGGSKTQRTSTRSRKQLAPWQRNRFNFGGPSKQNDGKGPLQLVNKIMQKLQLKWTDKPQFVTDDGKIGAWYATADMTGVTDTIYAALVKALNHNKIGYEIGNSWRAQWKQI